MTKLLSLVIVMIMAAFQADDKTLSKSDYIITVASADAIGGLLSGPGAVLASGAAALYFDVE